ncbi:unnamed protein product, partial [Amoebophrya sp. A120]
FQPVTWDAQPACRSYATNARGTPASLAVRISFTGDDDGGPRGVFRQPSGARAESDACDVLGPVLYRASFPGPTRLVVSSSGGRPRHPGESIRRRVARTWQPAPPHRLEKRQQLQGVRAARQGNPGANFRPESGRVAPFPSPMGAAAPILARK